MVSMPADGQFLSSPAEEDISCCIIAEVSANHNGSIDRAEQTRRKPYVVKTESAMNLAHVNGEQRNQKPDAQSQSEPE